jgi:protein phosphatase 2C family protein 2/3
LATALLIFLVCRPAIAEFRGPGVHHNFDDSDSGYDMEDHQKQSSSGGSGGRSFGIGGYRGRIIFLGDGTEVLTDSDDTEMFDNAEEDKDLASQVQVSRASVDGGADAQEEGKGKGAGDVDAAGSGVAGAGEGEVKFEGDAEGAAGAEEGTKVSGKETEGGGKDVQQHADQQQQQGKVNSNDGEAGVKKDA